jgi:hypothetical protein
MRAVERGDVETVVRGYGLSRWETSNLQLSAGLTPTPPQRAEAKATWRLLTEQMQLLKAPACIVDEFNFLVGWNGLMQRVWGLPNAPTGPIHLLDELYSTRMRRLLGEAWRRTATTACRYVHVRSLRVAGEPSFSKSLAALEKKYGNEFIADWNGALGFDDGSGDQVVADYAGAVVRLETSEGFIDYLSLQSPALAFTSLELHVQIPIGIESERRHAQLVAGVEPGQVVHCPRTGLR